MPVAVAAHQSLSASTKIDQSGGKTLFIDTRDELRTFALGEHVADELGKTVASGEPFRARDIDTFYGCRLRSFGWIRPSKKIWWLPITDVAPIGIILVVESLPFEPVDIVEARGLEGRIVKQSAVSAP